MNQPLIFPASTAMALLPRSPPPPPELELFVSTVKDELEEAEPEFPIPFPIPPRGADFTTTGSPEREAPKARFGEAGVDSLARAS